MKNLVLTLLVVVATGLFSSAQAQSSKMVGSYEYTSQDEYGNDNYGTIKITKKEGKYTVNVIPENGGNMKLLSLKVKENVITGDLNFDGNYVGISMKIANNKIAGTAAIPDGTERKFSAKKKVQS